MAGLVPALHEFSLHPPGFAGLAAPVVGGRDKPLHHSHRRTHRRRTGFTLVEVLVGLALLAMMMSMVAGTVRLGTRSWNRAEAVTADIDDIQAVQGLFRRMIQRADPAYASADPRDLTILFAGEPESLMLVAPQPASQGEGAWTLQRYVLDRSGRGLGLFLVWQPVTIAGPAGTPRRDLVLDRIAQLHFAYFGPAGPGEAAAWQDRWVDRDRLPYLIRISIERTGAGGGAWPDLVVATRVTTSAACLYDASSSGCRRVR